MANRIRFGAGGAWQQKTTHLMSNDIILMLNCIKYKTVRRIHKGMGVNFQSFDEVKNTILKQPTSNYRLFNSILGKYLIINEDFIEKIDFLSGIIFNENKRQPGYIEMVFD